MAFNRHILMRSISPKMISKVVSTFDRATTIVVGSCWAAALIIIIFAIYTLSLVANAHKNEAAALAAEPALPTITREQINKKDFAELVERIRKRYPDLTIAVTNQTLLKISSLDGTKFRQWLMALSYIEAISPKYQWTIQDFCVGKCKNAIMNASLTAEIITFKAPTEKK